MNLPPPMNTSRVQEALASLADYVVFANDIAAAVQPISLITQNVEPVVVSPAPRPEKAMVDSLGKKLTIEGQHLANVTNFMLIPVESPSNSESGGINNPKNNSVEAKLNKPLEAGRYEVWVIDDQGRGSFVRFDINTPIAPGPKPSSASYKIAAVVPDEVVVHCEKSQVRPEKVFVEVISEGDCFPDGINFEAVGDIVRCDKTISTGNPKALIIPIVINQNKALKHPTTVAHVAASVGGSRQVSAIDVTINVTSNAKIETAFKFNFLLL